MSQDEEKSHASRLRSRGSTASWKLRATSPDGAATELFLVDGLTIGRTNANSLQACDDGSGVVERSHARVDFKNDGSIVLKCLSQSASVETGGDTVSALRLDIGSTFRIGLTRFEVVAGVTTEQKAAGSVGSWCPYCGKEPTSSICSTSVTECDACGEPVIGVPPTSVQGAVAVLPGAFEDTEGGKYSIERFVARGGMGYVLKGRTHEDLIVAIKVLIFDGTSDVQAVARFKQEISLLRALQDPNVLRLIAHGQQAGLFFFVMEWVDGADLRSRLPVPGKSRTRVVYSDALRWFEQACMGLHAIHRAGAVHRDIKPSNLLLRDDGRLVIADLGVAKRLTHDETGMTCTGQLTGTYAYMAPEQQYAPDLVDPRTDIYSLGLTFWQLLTGYMYSGVDPQRPSEANDTVPPEFDGVLLSMLKSRIENRPGSILEVLLSVPQPPTGRANRDRPVSTPDRLTTVASTNSVVGAGSQDGWRSPVLTKAITGGEAGENRPDQIARGMAQVEGVLRRCDALVKALLSFLRTRLEPVLAGIANHAARCRQMLKSAWATPSLPVFPLPPVGARKPTETVQPTGGSSTGSVPEGDLAAAATCEKYVEKEVCGPVSRVGDRVLLAVQYAAAGVLVISVLHSMTVSTGSARTTPYPGKYGMLRWLLEDAVNSDTRAPVVKPESNQSSKVPVQRYVSLAPAPKATALSRAPSSQTAFPLGVSNPSVYSGVPRPRPNGAAMKVLKRLNAAANSRPALAVVPFDAAQARTHQQKWAESVSSEVALSNSIGQEFAFVPPGTFMMGQAGGDPDEVPHHVTLTTPFYIGVHEVTNAQWKRVMGSVPSQWKGDDLPVEMVSWADAVEFCRKLSSLSDERRAGRVYRLPTEAEWEYACRAGTPTKYSCGDYAPLLFAYAWFNGNREFRGYNSSGTTSVGQKRPNAWGLYDMHGNVWEWCSDWYGDYGSNAVTDPQGPSASVGRVLRGGAWGSTAANCRSARRNRYNPSVRHNDLGFRLALSPPGAEPVPPEAAIAQ